MTDFQQQQKSYYSKRFHNAHMLDNTNIILSNKSSAYPEKLLLFGGAQKYG